MKKYPEHSVVRIHTNTLDKLRKLGEILNMKPPKVIDWLVENAIKNMREETK